MNHQNCFKISEVAKLTNITRQTLIFYDKKNILKPAFVDNNNYRYYSVDQVHHIQIINMLKEFGIPLKKIKEYLDNRNKDQLLELLTGIQEEMYVRIQQTNHYINMIENKKDLIHKSMMIQDTDEIKLVKRKAFQVYKSHLLGPNDQAENHFRNQMQFERHLSNLGLVGLKLDVVCEKKYINREFSNHISYFCIKTNDVYPELETQTIKGGLYVSAYHKGKFQGSIETYNRMLDFIESNNLEVSGDSYETLISNYLTEENADDYLFEVSIKVRKISD